MSLRKKIFIVLGVLVLLFLAVAVTIPYWGYKVFTDMKLPRPEQVTGMYKPKNLLPMYGYLEKTADEKQGDEEFITEVVKAYGTKEAGSKQFVIFANSFLQKGDLNMAMKRFNDAWLLDDENPDAYIGFSEVLKKQGNADYANEMLKKATEIKK